MPRGTGAAMATSRSLQIARDAIWEGQVRASSAVIAGALTGSIECTGPVELGAAAVIKGSITARRWPSPMAR